MQQVRIIKDGKFESSTSHSQQKIPVVDVENSTPLKGSIAYNRESSATYPIADSIYYANGTQWLQVSPPPPPPPFIPITSVTAGPGVVATTIGTNVVVSLPNVGTGIPATHDFSHSFDTDSQGRVSSVSTGFLTGSDSGSKFFGPATTLTNLGAASLPWEYIYGQKAHIGLPNFTGVNDARLRLVGSANSINGGPNTEMYISSSVHPIKQTSGFSSGNISECYDCYFNGTEFVSSIGVGGSCVQLYKSPSNIFQMNSIRSPSTPGDSVSTIIGNDSNGLTMLPAAEIYIRKQISESSTFYTTGSVSQAGQIVTGVGTAWTNSMVGGLIVMEGGQHGLILTASPVSLTVNSINAITAGTSYTIYFGSSQTSRGSGSIVNQYLLGTQTFVGTSFNTVVEKQDPTALQTYTIPDFGAPISTSAATFSLYSTPVVTTGNSFGALIHSFTARCRMQGSLAIVEITDNSGQSNTNTGFIEIAGLIPIGYRPYSANGYTTLVRIFGPAGVARFTNMSIGSNGNVIFGRLVSDVINGPLIAVYLANYPWQGGTNEVTYMARA